MSSIVRNINKNQILAQDMALGVGEVTQTRNGDSVTGDRVDIFVSVSSYTEMGELNPTINNHALLRVASNDYREYIFDVEATEGIPSTSTTTGFWVPLLSTNNLVLTTNSSSSVSITGQDENNLISLTSESDVTVTVGRSEVDLGNGTVIDRFPVLVFIRADTLANVVFVADAGISISSSTNLSLYRDQSTAGLISLSATEWLLVGDLTPLDV